MSAHATVGRLLGYTALGIAGAMAILTVGSGLAAAVPRTPLATDDQAPAVPFDPGALLNAINDYASLLSFLTGGQSAQPGVGGPAGLGVPGSVPAPTDPYPMPPASADPYPMLPGLP